MKVSELEGRDLNWWVAKAVGMARVQDGIQVVVVAEDEWRRLTFYHPSTRWHIAGPIIERERIDVWYEGIEFDEPWSSTVCKEDGARIGNSYSGPTPLIAAMRAYVSSKFGEEVSDEN